MWPETEDKNKLKGESAKSITRCDRKLKCTQRATESTQPLQCMRYVHTSMNPQTP